MYGLIAKPILWYLDHAPARLQPPLVGILSYTAPRSGRWIRLVVLPMPVNGQWVVSVSNSRRKSWWKAFQVPLTAELEIGRVTRAVSGRVLGEDERAIWAQAYRDQFPGRKPRQDNSTPIVLFSPKPD